MIEIIGDRCENGMKFKYGNTTAELYDWDWRKVETKYNKVLKLLQEKVNSGEITLEFATEVCNIAYDKYVLNSIKKYN